MTNVIFLGGIFLNELFDKISLFVLCSALYALTINNPLIIVPIIISVTISALNTYTNRNQFKRFTFFAFLVICFYNPNFIVFLPLISYDLFDFPIKWLWLLSVVPIAFNFSKNPISASIFTLVIFLIAYLNKWRTNNLTKLKKEYILLRDNAKELSLKLENKHKDLLEKQDYEITVATLNERNRIARDIHDNVGHTLSSAILQTGAVIAITKEDQTKESLKVLKSTLLNGMENIRSSIHNLHNEAIDLQIEAKALVDDFHFCPMNFQYDISGSPPIKIKYCFLFIIKEALANIIKHSGATEVKIKLTEHPAIYQLIIKDNGTKKNNENDEGIGLKNISERVLNLNGIDNIEKNNGFTIFISVPKEGSN